MTKKESRSPRIQVHLSTTRLQALERYAEQQGSRPATEAALLLSRLLDEMEEQGKIPPPREESSDGEILQAYLKLLANGSPVPDELIQLVANETGMDEVELRKVSDTCNAQANQRLSK